MTLWDKINQLSGNIGKDMLEPVRYIPFGILAGGIFLLLYELWCRSRFQAEKEVPKRKKWILLSIVPFY